MSSVKKKNIKLYFKRHKQSWGNRITFHFLQKILKRLLKGSDPEPLITAPRVGSFHLSVRPPVHRSRVPGQAGCVEHQLSAAVRADPLWSLWRLSNCSTSRDTSFSLSFFDPILKRDVNRCRTCPFCTLPLTASVHTACVHRKILHCYHSHSSIKGYFL